LSLGLIFFRRQQLAEVLDIEAGYLLVQSKYSTAACRGWETFDSQEKNLVVTLVLTLTLVATLSPRASTLLQIKVRAASLPNNMGI
jgi:hypothetical protein